MRQISILADRALLVRSLFRAFDRAGTFQVFSCAVRQIPVPADRAILIRSLFRAFDRAGTLQFSGPTFTKGRTPKELADRAAAVNRGCFVTFCFTGTDRALTFPLVLLTNRAAPNGAQYGAADRACTFLLRFWTISPTCAIGRAKV